MDKKLVMAAGLMTLLAGFAEASCCNSSAAACEKTSEVAHVSMEEASFVSGFVSKLSQEHSIAFNLMNADQRLEVLTAAKKGDITPDAAVDGFMTHHHLAVVEGSLKTVE